MEYRSKVEIPARTEERITSITCDLCGKEGKSDRLHGADWSKNTYDKSETVIYHEAGEVYPEGGELNLEIVHICPECFEQKLIPWIKSQGGEPTTKEIDI